VTLWVRVSAVPPVRGRRRRGAFKNPWVPISYKVLRSPDLYKTKSRSQKPAMEKNPGENITTVEVDPITGEYYVTIPEWILNDFGWYEGTEVNMEVDGESIIITELKGD